MASRGSVPGTRTFIVFRSWKSSIRFALSDSRPVVGFARAQSTMCGSVEWNRIATQPQARRRLDLAEFHESCADGATRALEPCGERSDPFARIEPARERIVVLDRPGAAGVPRPGNRTASFGSRKDRIGGCCEQRKGGKDDAQRIGTLTRMVRREGLAGRRVHAVGPRTQLSDHGFAVHRVLAFSRGTWTDGARIEARGKSAGWPMPPVSSTRGDQASAGAALAANRTQDETAATDQHDRFHDEGVNPQRDVPQQPARDEGTGN